MKNVKLFVGSLIMCIALALTSVSASADTFTFSGHSLRVYETTTSGEVISGPVTVYKDYKIVIDMDNDVIYTTVGDKSYTFYIKSQRATGDSFKGVYLYCNGGLTFNIYRDHDDKGHIMITTETTISIYDL